MLRRILATLTIAGLVSLSCAYPQEDLVKSLDQMPDLSFGLYSGYVPIDNTSKKIHYMAALSKAGPTNSPIVIWFNGGPGCSSMLGFLQEHGPYALEDGNKKFTPNKYSWNNEANMFYIESPAGVGFSVCGNQQECKWNDENSADDNMVAILNILQKFPEIMYNDLYIAGESYAGIYVPKVMQRLDKYIQDNKNKSIYYPALKGFMVGNGVTDWKYDGTPAFIEMAYFQGLYGPDLYATLSQCDFSYYNFDERNLSLECLEALYSFDSLTSNINVYDVFGKCYNSNEFMQLYDTNSDFRLTKIDGQIKASKKFFTSTDYTPWVKLARNSAKKLKQVPPCVFAAPILDYLNDSQVRENLHIDSQAGAWDLCSSIDYTMGREGSIDIYTALKGKYRMFVYSGDTDGAVPMIGTLSWIKELNWPIIEQWRPYFVQGKKGSHNVAGYFESREGGFSFASVHGAGHMAPQWKRQQTYHAIFSFIKGTPF
eukprot:403359180